MASSNSTGTDIASQRAVNAIQFSRLILMLAAAVSVFLTLAAVIRKTETHDGLIFASNRAASEDNLFQAITLENSNVLYIRQGDPFYKSVRDFAIEKNPDAKNAQLLVVRAKREGSRFVAQELVATDNSSSLSAIDKYVLPSSAQSAETVILPSAVIMGLLIAGLKWLIRVPIYLWYSGASALAGYQYFAHCPTCPHTLVVGIPASFWGVVLFGIMALISLRSPFSTSLTNIAICAAGTSSLLWQIVVNYGAGTACSSCISIAFISAVAMGSLPKSFERGRMLSLLIPTASVTAACMLIASRDPFSSINEQSTHKLANKPFSMPVVNGRQAKDIGLILPTGRFAVAVIATGCDPCHDALNFFARHPDIALTVARIDHRVDGEPAGTLHVTPGLLQQTPTFLFIDEKGHIVGQRIGWSDAKDWQDALLRDTKQFLSERESAEGKKGEVR